MIDTVLLAVIAALLLAWTLVALVVGVAASRALGGARELLERARDLIETVAGLASGLTRRIP